jgi:hypothetical protein
LASTRSSSTNGQTPTSVASRTVHEGSLKGNGVAGREAVEADGTSHDQYLNRAGDTFALALCEKLAG